MNQKMLETLEEVLRDHRHDLGPVGTALLQTIIANEHQEGSLENIGVYKVGYGSDQMYYVEGPGDGLGYHSGTLWPELRCDTRKEAERAAKIANIAHDMGYRKAQRDIRKALGI